MNIEVWERGYIDHRIRDANDYVRHVEYIRQKPVEAKIVVRAEDYICACISEREKFQGWILLPAGTDRERTMVAR